MIIMMMARRRGEDDDANIEAVVGMSKNVTMYCVSGPVDTMCLLHIMSFVMCIGG